MNKIYKYELEKELTVLRMPKGAKILTVQTQYEKPCIWALINTDNDKENRSFLLIGTGNEILNVPMDYIGTFQLNGGTLVFHLFELK